MRVETHCNQQADNRNQVLASKLQRFHHGCQCYNGSTMLVIVENRNIAAFLQLFFNFKATRCGNIFEVDAAEAASEQTNGIDNVVYILGANAQRNRIYITELLEQGTLTFHNRHTCFRANVAQTQNSSTIGHNSNEVTSSGQLIAQVNVFLNFQTRLCNTWGICQRQIV